MIIVKIIGGLGNQIAQYAFGLCCARRLGVALKLDISGYQHYTLHAFGLSRFTLQAEVASTEEIAAARACGVVQETAVLFDPALLPQVRDGVYLDGYWFDYRYTAEVLPHLRRVFQPFENLLPTTLALLNTVRHTESVSLHIRRGDYVTNANCVVMPLTYYEDALREVAQRVPRAHVYVFSDDMAWAEEHLHVPLPHTFVRGNDASRNIDDFELMRGCKHHIVANSTFSSWAALLDAGTGLVIAPQQFFRPDDPWMLQTFGRVEQPLWPPGWLPMPVRLPVQPPALDFASIAGGHSAKRRIKIGVWNYYEELTTEGFIFRNSNASIGHNLLKPWVDLHGYGQAHGIDFVTLDQTAGPEDLDAILFMDRPRAGNQVVAQILARAIPKYLCIFETDVIKPDNWDLDYHHQFDRIFTWSDAHVDDKKYFKLNFAIDPHCPYDFEVLKSAFQQRKLCTLIAGAKTSPHTNELYSARVQTIRWLEAHAPQDFDLYGMGWSSEHFPSYRGTVQDKLATLARYRFAICYENAQNYPGYITEKILDCLRAGMVPVYWGAPNISRWIPEGCFIDRRQFADEAALHAHLVSIDATRYAQYLDCIRDFLSSPKAYPFSIECLITTISAYTARDVKRQRGESPRMTISIPSYNYGRYLHLAIGSALTQDVDSLEVLVLDNASTDETPTAVSSFLGNPNFRYMRNSHNLGAANNWMNAEIVACGEFFTILSADDFLLPGQLRRMRDLLQTYPEVGLAYSPCMLVNEASQPLQVLNHAGHAPSSYVGGRNEVVDLLQSDCYITPSAAVIRRTAFDRAGRMDASLNGALDWDMWIRMADATPHFAFFKDPLVCYRIHAEQDTDKLKLDARLLADHIRILEKAIQRDRLLDLQAHAPRIMGLLRYKFQSYPPEVVAHLKPGFLALESALGA
jgi:hypothetical protein